MQNGIQYRLRNLLSPIVLSIMREAQIMAYMPCSIVCLNIVLIIFTYGILFLLMYTIFTTTSH